MHWREETNFRDVVVSKGERGASSMVGMSDRSTTLRAQDNQYQ
jgi:hypothetical protein